MKKLEATNNSQQQQVLNTDNDSQIQSDVLAAAAFYQAQLLLLANPAAIACATAGYGMDNSAISEYYKQLIGYAWNDRTPTSSVMGETGTPVVSDVEEEGTLDSTSGEICSTRASPDKPIAKGSESGENKHKEKQNRSSRGSPEGTGLKSPVVIKDLTPVSSHKGTEFVEHVKVHRHKSANNLDKILAPDDKKSCQQSSSPAAGGKTMTRTDTNHHSSTKSDDFEDKATSSNQLNKKILSSADKMVPKRDSCHHHSPKRHREVRTTRELYRENNRRSHSSSRSPSRPRSSTRHTRSKSPSYSSHNKENVRRPSSLGRRRRLSGDYFDKRSCQSSSTLQTNTEGGSRSSRKLTRKRKHSITVSQQKVKRTKVENGMTESSTASGNQETSSLSSGPLTSPLSLSPSFDDITAPPTPNADEILPYCADVQLCENSAMLLFDAGIGQQNLLDISCPPTPTSELQNDEETVNTEGNKVHPQTNGDNNCEDENGNEKSMEAENTHLQKPEFSQSTGDCPKGHDSDTTPVSEVKAVAEGEEEGSDLEEGEITDSSLESGEESQSTKEETTMRGEVGRCAKVRDRSTSGTQQTNTSQVRDPLEKVNSKQNLSEKCHRKTTSRRSSKSVGYHERLSPRLCHHLPLSERRNRHSPPSSKKRNNETLDCDCMIRMHPQGERHAHRHSAIHRRSNLSEHRYTRRHQDRKQY